MVSFAQLRDMDTSNLTKAAGTAGDLSGSLSGRGEEVDAASYIPGDIWQSHDADAMSRLTKKQADPLWEASDTFQKGQAALEDLTDGLTSAKETLHDAIDLVSGSDVTISEDGTVNTPPEEDEEKAAHNSRVAKQARELIKEALEAAQAADERTSSIIESIAGNAEAWTDTNVREHSKGDIYEIKPNLGWRGTEDLDGVPLDWKVGIFGDAGGFVPNSYPYMPGIWGGLRAGADATFKGPSTDLGMDGVEFKGDINIAAGPTASQTIGFDPRGFDANVDSENNLHVEAKFDHTFDRLPITISVNPQAEIDLEEVHENLKIDKPELPDMPNLEDLKPW